MSSPSAAARQAAPLSRLQLLQQLLRRPAISSLCLLALMAQAARTAVDLLLPIMLKGSVQPGVIGLLFAGEAVGSVVAPFLVDGLLHRHSNKPRSSSSSNSTGGSCKRGQTGEQKGTRGMTEPSSSGSISYASWLLLLSAVGMAICCALVLTAWQLPSAVQQVSLHGQAGGAAAAAAHITGTGNKSIHSSDTAVAWGNAPHAAQQAAGQLAAGTASISWENQGTGSGSDGVVWTAGSFLVANASWVARSACVFVQLQVLRHGGRGGLLPAAASPAAYSPAFNPESGTVKFSERLLRSVSEMSHFVGESAGGSGCFGLAELAIIGLVLLFLGSLHSSCETLIYAVLTDIIAPSESDNVIDNSDDIWCGIVTAESEGSEGGGQCERVRLQQCQQHHPAAGPHVAPAVCGLAGVYASAAPQADVEAVYVDDRSDCSAAAAAAASGSSLGDAASVDAAAVDAVAANGSDEFDLEIQVNDGSPCSLKLAPSQDVSCLEDPTHFCDSHTSAKPAPVQVAAFSGAVDGSESDCTEVVMVLYVLFWVVGFSVGAAVVGLLPGTGLSQLQAVASVLAVLLATVGRWTWLAVATAA
jgi:hypothetical protein